MFNQSWLICAIILSITAPVKSSPVMEKGIRVPIQKRNALADDRGIFDHARAVRQVVRDHNKHRNNLQNLEKHAGRGAFNEGANIKPVMYLPEHARERRQLEDEPTTDIPALEFKRRQSEVESTIDIPALEFKRRQSEVESTIDIPALEFKRRQSENLTDEHNDEFWAANINVGTPSQTFYIDFDTGSSDLWFPSTDCTQSAADNKHKYNISASSSGKHADGLLEINYGDGSSVSGPLYTDTVSIAGVTVSDQYFSAVATISPSFGNQSSDGILGLGYPAISNIHQPTFVNTAKAQGAIQEAVFGIKLAQSGSELYIGGTDAAHYSGDIEYHNVDGSGFWQLGGGKVRVGSVTITTDMKTIIDSGTTIVYGPREPVVELYSQVPGAAVYDDSFFTIPCGRLPSDVSFNWGGKHWAISPENFNAGRVSADNDTCIGAIASKDLGLGDNVWLLGDSFMKNMYTVFSFENNAVGFANLS